MENEKYRIKIAEVLTDSKLTLPLKIIELESYTLSELKALKEECLKSLYEYNADKNSDITGAILVVDKVFKKRGI